MEMIFNILNFLDDLEKWIASVKSSDLYDPNCRELNHLNLKVKEFLSLRCSLLLKRYPTTESFLNQNVAKIIKYEKAILQSFVL